MSDAQRIDTQWFSNLLADRQISRRKLSTQLGLDPSTVSLMLRGKRQMRMDEAADMARLLGVPLDEILSHAGIDIPDQPKDGWVPIVGWVDEGFEAHMQPPSGPKRVKVGAVPPGTVAIRCQTADTQLGLYDGWVMFFKPLDHVPTDAVGHICVVELAGHGPRLIRGVRRGYEPGTFNLVSTVGPEKMESVSLKSASPILWIRP